MSRRRWRLALAAALVAFTATIVGVLLLRPQPPCPRPLQGPYARGLLELATAHATSGRDPQAPPTASPGASGDDPAAATGAPSHEAELLKIIAQARQALQGLHGLAAVSRLNHLLFTELAFRREVERHDPAVLLLPKVVEHRRGSCVGLASLYLVVAEELGLPVRGVLVPGHFFLRLESDGLVHNIELLRRGESLPEAWYRQHYRVPRQGRAYLRALSLKETLGVVRYNLGNTLRERGLREQALTEYRAAATAFPDLAEAHANIGLELQRRGDANKAEAAYIKALAANPCLPGLDANLATLYRRTGDEPRARLHESRVRDLTERCSPDSD